MCSLKQMVTKNDQDKILFVKFWDVLFDYASV